MKRLFCALLCTVIFTVSFSLFASAETHSLTGGIKITLPEDYIVLTDKSLKTNEETIAELGHSISSLRTYMDENHILFIAVDAQNKNQVQLGAVQTDFSKDIVDLSGLKAKDLNRIGQQMLNHNFEIISIHDWVYFKSKVEGLTGYATAQYTTIKNGMLYTLNYYGSNGAAANQIASGLEIPATAKNTRTKSLLISVLLWVALAAALITMIFLVASFISDFRQNHEENDVREYIRIKRRRRF